MHKKHNITDGEESCLPPVTHEQLQQVAKSPPVLRKMDDPLQQQSPSQPQFFANNTRPPSQGLVAPLASTAACSVDGESAALTSGDVSLQKQHSPTTEHLQRHGTSEQQSSLNSFALPEGNFLSHLSAAMESQPTNETSSAHDDSMYLSPDLSAEILPATLSESGKESAQQFPLENNSKKQLDLSLPARLTPQPLVTNFIPDANNQLSDLTPDSPAVNAITFKAVLNEPHIPLLHDSSVRIPPQDVLTKETSACDTALNSVSVRNSPPPFSDHILQHSSPVSVRGSEDHNQQVLSQSSPTHLLAHSPTVQRPITQPFDTEDFEEQNQRSSPISFPSHSMNSSSVSLKFNLPSSHLETDLKFVASPQPMTSTPPPVELTPPLPPDPSDGAAAQSMMQQLLGDQNQAGSSPETDSSDQSDLSDGGDAAVKQPGSCHATPTLVRYVGGWLQSAAICCSNTCQRSGLTIL